MESSHITRLISPHLTISTKLSHLTIAQLYNLPKGLYILLVLVSFFFYFLNCSETNYLRIHWTNFHNFFSPNDTSTYDDRSGPFFRFPRGVALATNLGQNWQNGLQSAGWRSETDRNMAFLIQTTAIL